MAVHFAGWGLDTATAVAALLLLMAWKAQVEIDTQTT
jgi:hypothetical protein